MTKIDLTSTAVEKGLDVAKDFLDKLIMPAVEESGLLIKDQISRFRFNNQINILVKAKKKCEDNGINPKQISFKLLCPLLEYASLEEDDMMQDKWATLLSNLVDSDQNIQNNIFPYLLSQISTNEFTILEVEFLNKPLFGFDSSYDESFTSIRINGLSSIEKSNLIRLGIIEKKEVQFISSSNNSFQSYNYTYKLKAKYEYHLTYLGLNFIKICVEKNNNISCP